MQGENGRRAGAELLVLRGDLRQLSAGSLASAKRIQGLRSRAFGSIAMLPLLLRLADQENGQDGIKIRARQLRGPLESADYPTLLDEVERLIVRYPLDTHGLLSTAPTVRSLEVAAGQHREMCAACHDHGPADTERPAFDLFTQAREIPAAEFAARMLVGIRGDRLTGLGNPFSDQELAALISLYANVSPPVPR